MNRNADAEGRLACPTCFDRQSRSPGHITYCEHRGVLQAWVYGIRVLIVNVKSLEEALDLLRETRDFCHAKRKGRRL
jgi:hypothetical protein